MDAAQCKVLVHEVIEEQIDHCRTSFLTKTEWYKSNFFAVIWAIVFFSAGIGTVVAWSYEPIKDIATLKQSFKSIDKKLDLVLKSTK